MMLICLQVSNLCVLCGKMTHALSRAAGPRELKVTGLNSPIQLHCECS